MLLFHGDIRNNRGFLNKIAACLVQRSFQESIKALNNAILANPLLREAYMHQVRSSYGPHWTPTDCDDGLSSFIRDLGISLNDEFMKTRSVPLFHGAIAAFKLALSLAPSDAAYRASTLSYLGQLLEDRYKMARSLNDLNEAIAMKEQAVQIVSRNDFKYADYCGYLADGLYIRYEKGKDIADLDNAILQNEVVVKFQSVLAKKDKQLHNLIHLLTLKLSQSDNATDLDRMIEAMNMFANSTPTGTEKSRRLHDLGQALMSRFDQKHVPDDLQRAINVLYEAAELATKDSTIYITCLSILGVALNAKYEQTNALEDLNGAICTSETVVRLTPPHDRPGFVALGLLAGQLQERFILTLTETDLDRAIVLKTQLANSSLGEHRAVVLSDLGSSLLLRHEYKGSVEDLNEAFIWIEGSLDLVPHDHPQRASFLGVRGHALHDQFKLSGSMEHLTGAIEIYRETCKLASTSIQLTTEWQRLGATLLSRFRKLENMDDLIECISLLERAIETSTTHPHRGRHLFDLGSALESRFEKTKSIEDLNKAIGLYDDSLKYTFANADDKATTLESLANALQTRYHQLQHNDDLDVAIEVLEDCLSVLPRAHRNRPWVLGRLSIALMLRCEQLTNNFAALDDKIDQAIAVGGEAIEEISDTHPGRSILFGSHGKALLSRYERSGSEEDLEFGISACEKALSLTSTEEDIRAIFLSTYGRGLLFRYQITKSLDDLNAAIEASSAGLALENIDKVEYDKMRVDLAELRLTRYERLRDTDDFQWVIDTFEGEVNSMPQSKPRRAAIVDRYGRAILQRARHARSADDLNSGIELRREALRLLPQHERHYRSLALSHLGAALLERSQRQLSPEDSMDDLHESIEAFQQAIQLTVDKEDSKSVCTSGLANAYLVMYQKTAAMADLDKGIHFYKSALLSAMTDYERSETLCTVSMALLARFGVLNSPTDLAHAISFARDAVRLWPDGDPERATSLITLCSNMIHAYDHTLSFTGESPGEMLETACLAGQDAVNVTPVDDCLLPHRWTVLSKALIRRGSMQDLEKAIFYCNKAINVTANDAPERVSILLTLATAFMVRSAPSKSLEDLDNSIRAAEEALGLLPEGSPNRYTCQGLLGKLLRHRFEYIGTEADLERSKHLYECVVRCAGAPPLARIETAEQAAKAFYSNDKTKAAELLKIAVELFPKSTPRNISRRDQQHVLSMFNGLPSMAAAITFQADGSAYEALRLLELGRGVLISLQIDVRTDITSLEEHYPEHAKRLKQLRQKIGPSHLDGILNTKESAHEFELQRAQISTASQELEFLVDEIRMYKGFERFLQGPAEKELMELACNGPIVVLNVGDRRSDAFIVTSSNIRVLPLPKADESTLSREAMRLRKTLLDLNLKTYRTAKREVRDILGWLWEAVVGPVLEELGFRETPESEDKWPHVWWISTSIFSLLPIHAAGYHAGSSSCNVLDRVVSSYATSLKSLAFARERVRCVPSNGPQKALLVNMSQTPNQSSLSYVDNEVKELEKLLTDEAISSCVLRSPNREQVITQLQSHQIVHFACHGHSRFDDPSESFLGLNDWETNPLTVTDLTTVTLDHAEFAYLSACHAADHRMNIDLLDEGIHLAGACQLAGFPHVVGTLWQINDELSARFAKEVYNTMLYFGRVDTASAAMGVHRATKHLRDGARKATDSRNLTEDPLVWAAYIHIGA